MKIDHKKKAPWMDTEGDHMCVNVSLRYFFGYCHSVHGSIEFSKCIIFCFSRLSTGSFQTTGSLA